MKRQQGGFVLIPAIFLIVVLAGIGAVAVRLGAAQNQTINLSLLSSRALAAANTGIEWAAYFVKNGGICNASTTLNFTSTHASLSGFTVVVNCTATTHTEGSATPNVRMFVVEAFASSGTYGTSDYVSRRVRARLTDAT